MGASATPEPGRGLHVAVIGASGFTGRELCRLLLGHPAVRRISPTSRGADRSLERVHRNLLGSGLEFRRPEDVLADASVDVAFFCTPTGEAMDAAPAVLAHGTRIVDLSADFRFRDPAVFARAHGVEHRAPELLEEAVYGLPELGRDGIARARLIANPGCYVVACSLALAPLVRHGVVDVDHPVSVFAVNGMSGAASAPRAGIMHTDVFGSMLPYNLRGHRHTPELEERLRAIGGATVAIDMTTAHGNFVRGICATASVALRPREGAAWDRSALLDVYARDYPRGREPFVAVNAFAAHGAGNDKEYDVYPAVKDVAGSNACQIGVDVDRFTGRAKVVSVIDNLVKGAAGNALQNMNLMFGLPEPTGLSAYGI